VDQPHRDLVSVPTAQPCIQPSIQPSTLLLRYHQHIDGPAVLRKLRSLCMRIGRCNSCRRSRSKDATIHYAHPLSQNCLERPSLLPGGTAAGSKMCFLSLFTLSSFLLPSTRATPPPHPILSAIPSRTLESCIISLPEATKDRTPHVRGDGRSETSAVALQHLTSLSGIKGPLCRR
jgi:hypothetical protein